MSEPRTTYPSHIHPPTDAYARDETIAQRIRRAGLPESYDVHWSDKRKADVVVAVREQRISFDEVRWHYLLSRSEFESWRCHKGLAEARHPRRVAAPEKV